MLQNKLDTSHRKIVEVNVIAVILGHSSSMAKNVKEYFTEKNGNSGAKIIPCSFGKGLFLPKNAEATSFESFLQIIAYSIQK